jgi:hypothetical protein
MKHCILVVTNDKPSRLSGAITSPVSSIAFGISSAAQAETSSPESTIARDAAIGQQAEE